MATNYGRTKRIFTSADVTHTNTTTEALAGSITIPANTLAAGDRIMLRGMGTVVDNNSTDTLTVRVVENGLAGNTLATSAATDVADNDMYAVEGWIYIDTIGASGAYSADVEVFLDTTPATVRTVTIATAIDTTADVVFGFGLDWSVAHADNEANTKCFDAVIFRSME